MKEYFRTSYLEKFLTNLQLFISYIVKLRSVNLTLNEYWTGLDSMEVKVSGNKSSSIQCTDRTVGTFGTTAGRSSGLTATVKLLSSGSRLV